MGSKWMRLGLVLGMVNMTAALRYDLRGGDLTHPSFISCFPLFRWEGGRSLLWFLSRWQRHVFGCAILRLSRSPSGSRKVGRGQASLSGRRRIAGIVCVPVEASIGLRGLSKYTQTTCKRDCFVGVAVEIGAGAAGWWGVGRHVVGTCRGEGREWEGGGGGR